MPVAWRNRGPASEMTFAPANTGHQIAGLDRNAVMSKGVIVMEDKPLPAPAPTKDTAPQPQTPVRFDDWASI